MKGLYRFKFDCGRMGQLDGLFIEETKFVDKLIESGIEVQFGEALGKHSEIYGPIEEEDIELITKDNGFISMCEEYDIEMGYNPFHCYSYSVDHEELGLDEDCNVYDIIETLIIKDEREQN